MLQPVIYRESAWDQPDFMGPDKYYKKFKKFTYKFLFIQILKWHKNECELPRKFKKSLMSLFKRIFGCYLKI